MVKPVKIFTTGNLPRLRYTADLILNEILGLSWEIVTDRRKLGKFPVINYSEEKIPNSFKINPVQLLFDTGVRPQKIIVDDLKGVPFFFSCSGDSDFQFDIFAATFYMVSRYEEYLEFKPDRYGRFSSSDSLAFKHRFTFIPVVDLWAREFAKSLVRKFQELTFKRSDYKPLITFDIDEPFAYLGMNLIGNIGGFLHDFASKSRNARNRMNCLTGGEKDPYDVFDYITESINRNKTEARFFVPVGDPSNFDYNPSWKNKEYRNLIKRIEGKFNIGIHPSFKASTDRALIKTEVQRFKTILKKDCLLSRFHYLRIAMPASYRNINEAGIIEDYSMGFNDESGYRAGIARPFRFYDVIGDRITDLRIFPFQIMDSTLKGNRNMKPTEAKELIRSLIQQTKKAGGLFISIWHNTSLLDSTEYKEWRDLFEFTLKEQMP